MSEANVLEKLLDGAEVEWVPMGGVTNIKTGQSVNKDIISNNSGAYPVINSGREPLGFIDKWNTNTDPIGITTRGAKVGSITWQEGKYFRGNLNYAVTIKDNANIETRYLYHLLQQMQSNIHALCTFDGIPALNSGNLKQLQIPIPCPEDPRKSLKIQAEIVRILDQFDALTNSISKGLPRELELRQKQYEYYRNQLLTFSMEKMLDGAQVAWLPVAELFHLKNGYTPSKSKKEFWEGGSIPWFRMDDIRQNGQILDDSLQKITKSAVKAGKLFPKNSIIISTTATIGEHALVTVPYLANQRFTNLTVKEEYIEITDIKYLYYCGFLLADWCKKNTTMSSFASVDMDGFRKFQIPIPCPDNPAKSLEIQAKIVRILNQFDALANSISEGLPREIELRKKQYEYYRDLLMRF